MTWAELHRQSEVLAADAELAAKAGDAERAELLYAQAADREEQALEKVQPAKARTLGITAVSAAALWYKAKRFDRAARLAQDYLERVPLFARDQLAELTLRLAEPVRIRTGAPPRRVDVA